jgi:hypothetical protein
MMKKTQLISLSKDSEKKQDLFVNTLQAMRSQEVTCLVTRLKTYSSTSGESSDQSKENSTNQIHKPANRRAKETLHPARRKKISKTQDITAQPACKRDSKPKPNYTRDPTTHHETS